MSLYRIQFSVYGRVQGVFFRKYTQEKAQSLGLKGMVQNMHDGSVHGFAEGKNSKISQFKDWLLVGSPSSKVEKVDIIEEINISDFSYDSFVVESDGNKI